jgi:hypothetical protein
MFVPTVVAHINENLLALEAVLADIQTLYLDQGINLGDCVSGPLWPHKLVTCSWRRTASSSAAIAIGDHDLARIGGSDWYAHSELIVDHRQ